MIFSDLEIRAAIEQGRLVFTPEIPRDSDRIGSSSVDLLLDSELLVYPQSPAAGIKVNPTQAGRSIRQLIQQLSSPASIEDGRPYTLEPGRLIIGKTLEFIQFAPDIAGRIEGRSSLARLGLAVHVTAPTVLAGWAGQLYLEIYNVGPFSIELEKNMPIAQLILERTGIPPDNPYSGQFQGQR